jgi:hypothetical protein
MEVVKEGGAGGKQKVGGYSRNFLNFIFWNTYLKVRLGTFLVTRQTIQPKKIAKYEIRNIVLNTIYFS